MPHPARLTAAVAVALTLGLAGCSDDLRQKTYPVTGKVTLDGQPLGGATVVFHPVDKTNFKWKELPQGTTGPDGTFSVFTYTKPDDGAPAGQYKVAVEVAPPPQDDEGGDQVKRTKGPRLPARYLDPAQSGLTATVEAKSTALPTFELKSK
jgi:hypothetical protein